VGDSFGVSFKPRANFLIIDNMDSSLSLSLLNGGTAGLFWNFVVVCFGFAAVYASIAELGSV
jgi:hypothetical protein